MGKLTKPNKSKQELNGNTHVTVLPLAGSVDSGGHTGSGDSGGRYGQVYMPPVTPPKQKKLNIGQNKVSARRDYGGRLGGAELTGTSGDEGDESVLDGTSGDQGDSG